MKINIHAGHAAVGHGATGAVDLLNESVEDRRVKDIVIKQLKAMGHTVYDCTVDSGTASQVLSSIVRKCNAHTVDLDVSIHFNAGHTDHGGDGKTTGTEVHIYSEGSATAKKYATQICASIAKLGFKNRGVKISPNLYFLKNTKSQALLVECCFVDDKDDAQLYNANSMASAIVEGITGKKYQSPKHKEDESSKSPKAETKTGDSSKLYKIQVGAYKNKASAEKTKKELKAKGFDAIIIQA